MLSTVVIAADAATPRQASPEAIVRTLGALVPGAIEGLIRDVTLAALADDPAMRQIADHAGCALAESADPAGIIAAGLMATRGSLLLVLRAGYAPGAGFFDELLDLFERSEARRPDAALLRVEPDSLLTRLSPGLARPAGLIAKRASLPTGARDFAALARGIGAARAMRARLRPVD